MNDIILFFMVLFDFIIVFAVYFQYKINNYNRIKYNLNNDLLKIYTERVEILIKNVSISENYINVLERKLNE